MKIQVGKHYRDKMGFINLIDGVNIEYGVATFTSVEVLNHSYRGRYYQDGISYCEVPQWELIEEVSDEEVAMFLLGAQK